jgi:hypothetical protein
MPSRRFAGQTLQNRKLLISDPQELLSTDAYGDKEREDDFDHGLTLLARRNVASPG